MIQIKKNDASININLNLW